MSKLNGASVIFDQLLANHDSTVYTEEMIIQALSSNEINLNQYQVLDDMKPSVINSIIQKVSNGKLACLQEGQLQVILDLLKEILVLCKTEIPIIAKCLRYLLRKDKSNKFAFVIVDVQNDFISGALALRHCPGKQEGEEVVPVINDILVGNKFAGVFYTIDWHPKDHCSYITNVKKYKLDKSSPVTAENAKVMDTVIFAEPKVLEQVMWPVHCTQDSDGAKLHPDLKVVDNSINVYKGVIPYVDSYSGVWDNGKLSRSDLLGHLYDLDITDVFVCGLATDFCVGFTALDIAEQGFNTLVVMDACRGVANESIDGMTKKMEKAGCKIIKACDIKKYCSGK